MHITHLTCEPNDKHVTIVLSYDEVRDVANGLYWLSQATIDRSDYHIEKYKDITTKMAFLFDMVKHGMIQSNTIQNMANKIATNETKTCVLSDDEIQAFNDAMVLICSSEYFTSIMKFAFAEWYQKIVPTEQQSDTVNHCIQRYFDNLASKQKGTETK